MLHATFAALVPALGASVGWLALEENGALEKVPSVRGRVIDERGRPVPGVVVQLVLVWMPATHGSGRALSDDVAISDRRGEFAFVDYDRGHWEYGDVGGLRLRRGTGFHDVNLRGDGDIVLPDELTFMMSEGSRAPMPARVRGQLLCPEGSTAAIVTADTPMGWSRSGDPRDDQPMVFGVPDHVTMFREMGAPISGFADDGSFALPLSHWGRVELHAQCAGDGRSHRRRVELDIARGETRDGVLIDLRDGGDRDLR
jgi:hypothetical protein